jgi:hypothetical protein
LPQSRRDRGAHIIVNGYSVRPLRLSVSAAQ